MTEPRVVYRERQVLQARDLADEQAYHVAQQRRHRLAAHDPGIVAGLDLVVRNGVPQVTPGLAVDGQGHDLRVSEPLLLSPPPATAGAAGEDVFLVFTQEIDRTAGGERWREGAEARQVPRQVPVTAAEGDAAPPSEARPGVFLGRITLAPGSREVQVSRAGRRQIGLVGASVEAPSGGARIDLPQEPGGDHFAISVRAPDGSLVPRIVLDSEQAALRGPVAVAGTLRVAGAFQLREPPAPPAGRAMPWSVYRAGAGSAAELRLEIAAGETAARQSAAVVVGGDKGPQPCLTISAEAVHLLGKLIVKGHLVESPVQPTRRDPRFLPSLLQSLGEGRGQEAAKQLVPLGMEVRKHAAVEAAAPGSLVDYGYFVLNTGLAQLTVTLEDSRYGIICRNAAVRPGETVIWRARLPVPQDAAGRLDTTVNAIGIAPDGRTVSGRQAHSLAVPGRGPGEYVDGK